MRELREGLGADALLELLHDLEREIDAIHRRLARLFHVVPFTRARRPFGETRVAAAQADAVAIAEPRRHSLQRLLAARAQPAIGVHVAETGQHERERAALAAER